MRGRFGRGQRVLGKYLQQHCAVVMLLLLLEEKSCCCYYHWHKKY
jgi:hypothetical protein